MSWQKIVNQLDRLQRSNKYTSFIYAVIKKYSEDNGGYQGALITYYAVLSLFPLLIVLTTLTKLFFRNDISLRDRLSQSITRYFPVVGDEIQKGIHDLKRTGVLLIVTLAITIYGSRGVANVMQFSLNAVWHIPKSKRPPFLQSISRSFSIIAIGSIGLISASVISGYVVHLGHFFGLKVLATVLSLIITWLTLIGVFKLAIAGNKKLHDVWRGAALAAVGIQVLLLAGNAILAHELSKLNTRYGVFGLVIGLMFWLSLLAQVILYAAQVDAVRHYRLYPRHINEPKDN